MAIPPKRKQYSNDFQTPPYAVKPLLPFLKKDWVIWECASGKGNLVKTLENEGFKVIGTDILQGYDFLKWKPEKFDCIVTNPPYSLRYEFLERAYELGKPFAMLMTLTTLEGKRQKLFREYGIELLLLDKRINFETPSGKGSGAWFPVAWFCWKLLPEKIVFGELSLHKS